jgi:hypothetical protein
LLIDDSPSALSQVERMPADGGSRLSASAAMQVATEPAVAVFVTHIDMPDTPQKPFSKVRLFRAVALPVRSPAASPKVQPGV